MILELHFVIYIRIFFGPCHVTFPHMDLLSFFGHCHVTFPFMEPLSFFGRFVQKVIVSSFFRFFVSIFIAAFRWQPLCYKQSPAFTQNSRKRIFFFLQIHLENALFVKNTASPIMTTKRVFYPPVSIIFYYLETLS